MKRVSILVLSLVLVLIVAGCAPKTAPAPQAAAPASPTVTGQAVSPQTPAKEAWQVEWEKVVNAAKKEGTVVLYSTAGGIMRQAMSDAFRARYGLGVEMLSGKGAEVSAKLISERNAGLYLADVYIGGTTTPINQLKPIGVLDPLEPVLILPEVVDPKMWFGGALRWVDPAHTILVFLGYPNTNVAINTKLVKPEEIKSYRDLLNPRWKGKIVMNDPTVAGTGAKTFAVVGWHIMDLDFWREVAKQEPLVIRDQRLMVEWLAHGKYALLLFPDTPTMTEFMNAGAPLAWITPVEGTYLSSGHGNVALVNRAAHPNAAKLFINWLLSKEGQTVFSKAYGSQSNRVDVPAEGLDPLKVRQTGVKYFLEADKEDFLLKQPEQMRIAKEIFGAFMK